MEMIILGDHAGGGGGGGGAQEQGTGSGNDHLWGGRAQELGLVKALKKNN